MNTTDEDLCLFCGEPAVVDVVEYFAEGRSFLLDTCCESMHEYAISVMPTLGRRECPAWTVDPGLKVCDVEWSVAREFVRTRHRHNARLRAGSSAQALPPAAS